MSATEDFDYIFGQTPSCIHPACVPCKDLYARRARLRPLCEAFDKAVDALEVAEEIQAELSTSQELAMSRSEAADLIRAHVARETVAKDKRIAELEAAVKSARESAGGIELNLGNYDDGDVRSLQNNMFEVIDILDAALAGQAKEEGR